jgi:hypothetical protein
MKWDKLAAHKRTRVTISPAGTARQAGSFLLACPQTPQAHSTRPISARRFRPPGEPPSRRCRIIRSYLRQITRICSPRSGWPVPAPNPTEARSSVVPAPWSKTPSSPMRCRSATRRGQCETPMTCRHPTRTSRHRSSPTNPQQVATRRMFQPVHGSPLSRSAQIMRCVPSLQHNDLTRRSRPGHRPAQRRGQRTSRPSGQ